MRGRRGRVSVPPRDLARLRASRGYEVEPVLSPEEVESGLRAGRKTSSVQYSGAPPQRRLTGRPRSQRLARETPRPAAAVRREATGKEQPLQRLGDPAFRGDCMTDIAHPHASGIGVLDVDGPLRESPIGVASCSCLKGAGFAGGAS